ncbi:hypothetical protein BDB00DRAFT_805139, partial [Zychaea mexicana]|uniref:uncharacterized protein n=1 Tax=Zychaea mexicana TaxID=64656 RepID=UPI0022FEE68F
MPPTNLMLRFPKLTHLSLLYDNKVTFPTITDNTNLTILDEYHNLVYLHLKIPFGGQIETCIIPVLRRCPQLKCLLVAAASSHTITSPSSTANTIDLDSIFELCPRLQYVMWNMHRVYLRRDEAHLPKWRQISTRTLHSSDIDKARSRGSSSKEGRIQGLVFEGHIDDINSVTPILTRSQETLSHLELFNVDMDRSRDWHDIPVYTQFPRLVTLKMTNLEMPREEGWVDLFAGCRNLKCLDVSLGPFDMRWDRIIKGITSSLRRLEHLRLHDNDYRAAPHVEFGDCIRMLSKYSSLRRLDLHNTCISDQNLIDLCKVRSLQELSLQMGLEDNETLLKFADKLKETNSSLDTLKLISVHNLNDVVLERLAQVKSLSLISVLWNSQITDAGVKAFVRGSTINDTGVMKKKKAFVDQCPSVSKWGMWITD